MAAHIGVCIIASESGRDTVSIDQNSDNVAGADPARKFRGDDFSNIWQSSISWQPSVFPNCTKSWWKKLLSWVLGEAIAPIAPPGSAPATLSRVHCVIQSSTLFKLQMPFQNNVVGHCWCGFNLMGIFPSSTVPTEFSYFSVENNWKTNSIPLTFLFWYHDSEDFARALLSQTLFLQNIRTNHCFLLLWNPLKSRFCNI